MNGLKTRLGRMDHRAFTLIELLIAVIIIGILVSIIVAVYANRAREARLTAAISDLDALRTAQEHAAIDTGYFYRLYVLDDVAGDGDNFAPDNYANDRIDALRDEALRGDTPDGRNIFIDTVDGEILTNGASIFARKITAYDGAEETILNWKGPYVNYHRKISVKNPPTGGAQGQVAGAPIDPWGNSYFFFTKKGMVIEDLGAVRETAIVNGHTYDALMFDRPTVLSFGPNGLPGDGTPPGTSARSNFGQDDDLYRQF